MIDGKSVTVIGEYFFNYGRSKEVTKLKSYERTKTNLRGLVW